MSCCSNCFNDEKLKSYIERHGTVSTCLYCNSQNTECIDETELYELFQEVFELYSRLGHGFDYIFMKKRNAPNPNTLINLIQADWNIFNEQSINHRDIANIIFNITSKNSKLAIYPNDTLSMIWVRDFDRYYGYFISSDWDNFCNSIKHKNRFQHYLLDEYGFNPSEAFNNEVFREVEGRIKKGSILYRAREGCERSKDSGDLQAFPGRKMGIPSSKIISNGRGNPYGINYLYTSDKESTTLSEIRAWKGAIVSLATIVATKNLRIVDLTALPELDNPFVRNLRKKIRTTNILKVFSEELSKPVDPKSTIIDYIPTQYICELIKNKGYEGLKFRSSLGDGNNVLLFNSKGIKISNVKLVKVTDISYEYEVFSQCTNRQ